MDAEIRRFKNRVRQQRYRARKCEEKIKRDSNGSGADVANVLPGLKHERKSMDVKSIQEKSEIRLNEGNEKCSDKAARGVEFGKEDFNKCNEGCNLSYIDTESLHAKSKTITLHGNAGITHGDRVKVHTPMIFQPSSKMEDGYCMDALPKPGHTKGHNDIMIRRLKNRERQRRYRARKRLEADMNKVHPKNQPTSLQVGLQPSGIIKLDSRMRRHRDWKKDARNAHLLTTPEVTQIGLNVITMDLSGENDSHMKTRLPSECLMSSSSCEASGPMHRRRYWKAAARNKVG